MTPDDLKRAGVRPPKRYWIQVRGFDGYEIVAETASKARMKSFRSYQDAISCKTSFRDFLSLIEVFHHLGRTPEPHPISTGAHP